MVWQRGETQSGLERGGDRGGEGGRGVSGRGC